VERNRLKIAVNVSAVQLHNAKFVQELQQILLEFGLPPAPSGD